MKFGTICSLIENSLLNHRYANALLVYWSIWLPSFSTFLNHPHASHTLYAAWLSRKIGAKLIISSRFFTIKPKVPLRGWNKCFKSVAREQYIKKNTGIRTRNIHQYFGSISAPQVLHVRFSNGLAYRKSQSLGLHLCSSMLSSPTNSARCFNVCDIDDSIHLQYWYSLLG